MKLLTVVPARLKSARLPHKPLLKIAGKTMIRRTLERVLAAGLSPVALATDAEEILHECADIPGVIPVMTREDHSCGTERVLECYKKLQPRLGDFDLIINVQGDEPFIEADLLRELVWELERRQGKAEFFTTVADLPEDERADVNVAKAVLDQNDNALIFTREPLHLAKKHTSVYVYSPAFLIRFCSLPPSPLEKAYRLEQMRALDNGLRLNCIYLPYDSVSINDLKDLAKAGVTDFEPWNPA